MQKMSGLIVKRPEFYFTHEDPLYVSKINFGKNINKEIVLISGPKSEATAHGIIKLKQSIKIGDIEDVAERVPSAVLVNMQDTNQQLYAFPVVRVNHFDEPRPITDGLENGQQNWVREVKFQRMLLEDYENLSTPKLQSIHDKIHSYFDGSEELFFSHYMVAEQFKQQDMTHPYLDKLDIDYEVLRIKNKTKDKEFSSQEEFMDFLDNSKYYKNHDLKNVIALNMREEYVEDNNPLLNNAGRWTKDIVKDWVSFDISDSTAQEMAQKANKIFREYLKNYVNPAYALQMAVAKSVAQVKE